MFGSRRAIVIDEGIREALAGEGRLLADPISLGDDADL